MNRISERAETIHCTGDRSFNTQEDIAMPAFFFFLAWGPGYSAVLFWEADQQISSGTAWASEVCSTSQMFCHHPEYLAYAGGVMLILAIGFKFASAMK